MFSVLMISIFVLTAILGFIATVLNKRRMERGLGRKVDKLEANSISNWMEVAESEERNG